MDIKYNSIQIQFILFQKLNIFNISKILSLKLMNLNSVNLYTLEIDFTYLVIIIYSIMVIL